MIDNGPSENAKSDNNSERLEFVINATGVGIWDWQVQTGELTFNERWAEIIGYTVDELLPIQFDTWSTNLHPEDLAKAEALLKQYFNGDDPVYEVEARMQHKSGHYVWVMASGKLVEWDKDGNPKRMIGTHLDITERKKSEERLIVTSQLLNESQQVAKVGGWELNLTSGHLFWTDETYRIHDTSPEEFNPTVDAGVDYFLPESKARLIQAIDDAINLGIGYDLELETFTTKNRKIDVRTTCFVTQEGGKSVRLAGIFQDISEQKNIQRTLESTNLHLEQANAALKLTAHYDALTGLPNRNLLADRMRQALSRSVRNNKIVAIAFIDLDSFKEVNDTYGHTVGDELLKKVSKRLTHVLRNGDTLSRIGGDEFVAMIDNLTSTDESELVLSRMLKSIAKRIIIDGKVLNISASIGVTFYPSDGVDSDQLLRHADQAMYIAKQSGKNSYHVFDVQKSVDFQHKNEELRRIAQGFINEEFELYYQPKIDLRNNKVVGAEALIRWAHPEYGVLGPHKFLPAVEYNPLGIEIGKWVIITALKQVQEWQRHGYDMPISVNISPLQLQHAEFVNELRDILVQFPDFRPHSIEFEIVESSALEDVESISKVIDACNQIGISFAIDDFGTGYSSLTYIKRLPVKYLKIDQSFVRDMLVDLDDKAIIQGIIELAKVFHLEIIAEGVETPAHGELLLSFGCFVAQGYAIAKPMPADRVLCWLSEWDENPCMVDSTI